jgi:hypothetical protein
MTDQLAALRAAVIAGDESRGQAVLAELAASDVAHSLIARTLLEAAIDARQASLHQRSGGAPVYGDGAVLTEATGPGKPAPQPATPEPMTSSRAPAHTDRAHSALERLADADPGTAAITHALLAVAAVIEDAAQRQAEDADTVAAMLDDRLTSIEGAIDAVTVGSAPPYRRARSSLRIGRSRSRLEVS